MRNLWSGVWMLYRLRPNATPEELGYIEVKWRDLNYSELQGFRQTREHSRIVFTRIYEACVVDGPSLDDIPAGIAVWIAKQQLEQNPFNGRYETIAPALEAARSKVTANWRKAACAVVAGTFRYSLEEIDSWPPDVFLERLAMAELLTGIPVNPADPKAPQKQKPGKTPARPAPGSSRSRPQAQSVVEQTGSFTRKR